MAGPDCPPSYKWIALGVTSLGVLMTAIDTTVVVLALPPMLTELHSNLVKMIWVIMAYILASTVLLLALGRVADIYGRVRLYNLGFVIFTVGSALCGLAQTDSQLIAYRVVQGIGGALLIVNSLAIITEAFPSHERGTAMGYNSVTFGTGSIIGPVLGGFILAVASWRWIFLINVPIGLVGTYLGYRFLRECTRRTTEERVDLVGALLFSLSLLSLLLALTQGISMGWLSAPILGLFGGFLVLLLVFVWWERRSSSPALDLSLFRSRLFDFSVLAAMLQSLAIFSVQLLVVLYLQSVKGYTPLRAALLLLPLPAVNAVIGPIGGRISDRVGARLPATVGLLIQAAALFWLGLLTVHSSHAQLAFGLALTGLGGGLFYSPNTSSAMSAAPPHRLGVAAATLTTLRNCGIVTSFALALAVAAAALPQETMLRIFIGTSTHLHTDAMLAFVQGMHAAFHVSLYICLAAAAMSLVRGSEDRRGKKATT